MLVAACGVVGLIAAYAWSRQLREQEERAFGEKIAKRYAIPDHLPEPSGTRLTRARSASAAYSRSV